MRRLIAAAAALSLLTACGGKSTGEVDPASIADDAPIYVEVVNNFALPVEIIATGSGMLQRLGTVHPGMTAHYRLPKVFGHGRTFELQAKPSATGSSNNPSYRSAELLLAPGSIVDLTVAAVLFNSTTNVRP